jgi:anti-anti-sigma regulatory factor
MQPAFQNAKRGGKKRMIEIQTDNEGKVVVKGEATIHFIKEFHESLLGKLAENENRWKKGLWLDLGELTAMDTAGAQALLAFVKSCGAREISIDSCSESILPFLEMAGLKRHVK